MRDRGAKPVHDCNDQGAPVQRPSNPSQRDGTTDPHPKNPSSTSAGWVALRCCAVQETRLDTARIRAARRVIDPVFLDTPLYRCEALEPGLGCTVSIKLETANPVRSFKARGTEVVASLLTDHASRAVVCASAGNLGQPPAGWRSRPGLDVTVVHFLVPPTG